MPHTILQNAWVTFLEAPKAAAMKSVSRQTIVAHATVNKRGGWSSSD